jgi:hypothetical protein
VRTQVPAHSCQHQRHWPSTPSRGTKTCLRDRNNNGGQARLYAMHIRRASSATAARSTAWRAGEQDIRCRGAPGDVPPEQRPQVSRAGRHSERLGVPGSMGFYPMTAGITDGRYVYVPSAEIRRGADGSRSLCVRHHPGRRAGTGGECLVVKLHRLRRGQRLRGVRRGEWLRIQGGSVLGPTPVSCSADITDDFRMRVGQLVGR